MGLVTTKGDGRRPPSEMRDDGVLWEIVYWPGHDSRVGRIVQRVDDELHFVGEPSAIRFPLYFGQLDNLDVLVRPLPPGTDLRTT